MVDEQNCGQIETENNATTFFKQNFNIQYRISVLPVASWGSVAFCGVFYGAQMQCVMHFALL